jgi:hypothetical protein
VTGVVVDDVDEGTAALPQVLALDRRAVRRRFDERFSAAHMAKEYLSVYRSLLKRSQTERQVDDDSLRLAPDMTIEAPRAHIDS